MDGCSGPGRTFSLQGVGYQPRALILVSPRVGVCGCRLVCAWTVACQEKGGEGGNNLGCFGSRVHFKTKQPLEVDSGTLVVLGLK